MKHERGFPAGWPCHRSRGVVTPIHRIDHRDPSGRGRNAIRGHSPAHRLARDPARHEAGRRNPLLTTVATNALNATAATMPAGAGSTREARTPVADSTTCAPATMPTTATTLRPRSRNWSYTCERSPVNSGRCERTRRRTATTVSVTGTATHNAHPTAHGTGAPGASEPAAVR